MERMHDKYDKLERKARLEAAAQFDNSTAERSNIFAGLSIEVGRLILTLDKNNEVVLYDAGEPVAVLRVVKGWNNHARISVEAIPRVTVIRRGRTSKTSAADLLAEYGEKISGTHETTNRSDGRDMYSPGRDGEDPD